MAFQEITQATFESIVLITTELPPAALPLARVVLARVVLARTTDRHLPDNVKEGLERLFSDNPLDAEDEVYRAVGDLMDIGIRRDKSPEAKARIAQAQAVLIEEGALGDALAAMRWLREVQTLAAADGIATPLH